MAARSHVTDTGRMHTCRRGPPWHGVALAAPDGWAPVRSRGEQVPPTPLPSERPRLLGLRGSVTPPFPTLERKRTSSDATSFVKPDFPPQNIAEAVRSPFLPRSRTCGGRHAPHGHAPHGTAVFPRGSKEQKPSRGGLGRSMLLKAPALPYLG